VSGKVDLKCRTSLVAEIPETRQHFFYFFSFFSFPPDDLIAVSDYGHDLAGSARRGELVSASRRNELSKPFAT
jgi:hypothetical protein